MVNQNDRYFYLSGAISIFMFGAVIALFGAMLINGTMVKNYALKKDDFISVSIDMTTLDALPKDITKPVEQPVDTPAPAPTKEERTQPDAVQDVSSLFENVWTQKVSNKPKKETPTVDVKRIRAIEKRIETKQVNESSDATETIKKVELKRPAAELVGGSTSSASEVNEYLARIQAFVYQHFYPPANSEGQSSKIRIALNGQGTLTSYRVLVKSSNVMFNDEVELLEKRLKGLVFPKNPNNESMTIDIILIAKE
jgi:protein TonB